MKKIFFSTIIILIPMFYILVNCTKKNDTSSGNSNSLALSGVLGSGLNGASLNASGKLASKNEANSIASVNGIIAIPLWDGKMYARAMTNAVTGTIDTNGNMSISLSKAYDYVVLLLDTTQTRKIDQVVGYLNLADAGKALMRLPVSDTSAASIDVGTVTQSSGTKAATTSKSLDDLSAHFSVNLSLLREIAKTDAALATAKNVYANYTSETKYADTSAYFIFNGLQSTAMSQWSAPTDAVYSGYGLYFSLAIPGVKIGDVCAASGAKVLKLTPPTAITGATMDSNYNVIDGSQYTSIDNSGVGAPTASSGPSFSCIGPHSLGAAQIYIHGDPSEENFGFNWGSDSGFRGSVATGDWVLTLDGTEVGRFDLKAISVLDSQGHSNVYVPSIKVTLSAGNVIQSIAIKLYTWDANSSSYVAVTDTSVFEDITMDVAISLADQTQSPILSKDYSLGTSVDGVYTLSNFDGITWKQKSNGTGTATSAFATSIGFNYNLYGASMRFDFR